MITSKRILHLLVSLAVCTSVAAQSSGISLNNTNSPFSRYGIGLLNDGGFANSRAMGGVGYALRDGRQINPLNPASYSKVDSLTFLFDIGMSMQMSNFSENGSNIWANNASFDYVAMQFRLMPGLGITAGLKPYSFVGYNLGYEEDITDPETGNTVASKHNYYGKDGFSEVFLGLGYNPIKNLSVGFNLSYMYGSISKASTVTSDAFSDATQLGVMDIYDYKLDLGAQYSLLLNKKKQRALTLGAVYSLGHTMNTSSVKTKNLSATDVDANLKMPHSIGLGAAYTDEYWTVEGDYNLQLWDQTFTDPISAGTPYANQPLCNRSRYSAGAEWVPNRFSNDYTKRIKYRFGAYYTTPYYKMVNTAGNWVSGPTEFGVSAGFGLPVPILLNRSIVNISLQYSRTSAKDMLTDNTFRLSIGLTFNETWFKKWKVE